MSENDQEARRAIQEHIREVFLGYPITVISFKDQIASMENVSGSIEISHE